ncbi:Abi-alpha family protein [Weissella confusa]|uniref:DUF4393 domain-containing protein n=1 Tax=Weissella confusa TaxID=1583 RepID=A0A4Z0S2Z4_WEICO|nr:Abi-alpha family protein [Weissella confusa]TGE72439.1 hypothetical protein C6P11_06165 [Weissella confusa]
MDPDTIGKLADATKAGADALSLPDEVKTAALKKPAQTIGDIVTRFFNRNQLAKREQEIVEDGYLSALAAQTQIYFDENPHATLDESKAFLIGKQIQDSRFSIDNQTMRQRFAKLISATADATRNSSISPNYSSVLANLTPESADLLIRMSNKEFVPVGFFKIVEQETGNTIKNITQVLEIDHQLLMPAQGTLDELRGLGLLDFSEEATTNKELYQQIDLLELEQTQNNNLGKTTYHHGITWLTIFGKSFIDVVK